MPPPGSSGWIPGPHLPGLEASGGDGVCPVGARFSKSQIPTRSVSPAHANEVRKDAATEAKKNFMRTRHSLVGIRCGHKSKRGIVTITTKKIYHEFTVIT